MHKRAFQAPKRMFMHVSGPRPPYFDNKLIYKVIGFIIKIWWGKKCDMHKSVFQGLKRTFMRFSGLLPPYFGNKTKYYIN